MIHHHDAWWESALETVKAMETDWPILETAQSIEDDGLVILETTPQDDVYVPIGWGAYILRTDYARGLVHALLFGIAIGSILQWLIAANLHHYFPH